MTLHAYPLAPCLTFRRQIEAFRKFLHQEIHPLQMLVFLEVVNSPDNTVSVNYVRQQLQISQSSASRHCRVLTHRVSPSKAGYGVCEWVASADDYRSKYLKLTEKGIEAATLLSAFFKK